MKLLMSLLRNLFILDHIQNFGQLAETSGFICSSIISILKAVHSKHPQKINVWCGISGNHILEPLFVSWNLTGELNSNTLKNVIDLMTTEKAKLITSLVDSLNGDLERAGQLNSLSIRSIYGLYIFVWNRLKICKTWTQKHKIQ